MSFNGIKRKGFEAKKPSLLHSYRSQVHLAYRQSAVSNENCRLLLCADVFLRHSRRRIAVSWKKDGVKLMQETKTRKEQVLMAGS